MKFMGTKYDSLMDLFRAELKVGEKKTSSSGEGTGPTSKTSW